MKYTLRKIYALLAVILMAAGASTAFAQEDYRFDMGGGIGTTGYLGDANTANLMQNPGFDAALLFRYIANPRWNYKTALYIGSLRGNTAQMTNVLPDKKQFAFSTTFYELSEAVEFHFFNYGMGEYYRHLKRFSPYITAGLGLTLFNADGNLAFSPVIPMGIGFKYKPALRWNLGLEFLMKKSFTDKVDGPNLSDPYDIKSGFAKNTDWYSTLSFTVSYEFSKRCATCNYKE